MGAFEYRQAEENRQQGGHQSRQGSRITAAVTLVPRVLDAEEYGLKGP